MTVNECIEKLLALGFTQQEAERPWTQGFALKCPKQTLVVLFRDGGIDLKTVHDSLKTRLDPESGRLQSRLDKFIRNSFFEAGTSVTAYITRAARAFAEEGELPFEFMRELGTYEDPSRPCLNFNIKSNEQTELASSPAKMSRSTGGSSWGRDLYDDMNFDGEPVYLSDGVWLNSDGSTFES